MDAHVAAGGDTTRTHRVRPVLVSRNVAKLAPLVNEPNKGESANCVLRAPQSQALGPRQCGHFYLVAARNVPPGEELTWHYGAGYDPRDYAVGEAVTVAYPYTSPRGGPGDAN